MRNRLSLIFISLFILLISIVLVSWIISYNYKSEIKRNNNINFLLEQIKKQHNIEFFWTDKIIYNSLSTNLNITENHLVLSKILRVLNTGGKVNELYENISQFNFEISEKTKVDTLNSLIKDFYSTVKVLIELKDEVSVQKNMDQSTYDYTIPANFIVGLTKIFQKHSKITNFITDFQEQISYENDKTYQSIFTILTISFLLFLFITIVVFSQLNKKVYHSLDFIRKITEEATHDKFRENISVRYASLPEDIVANLKVLFSKFQNTNAIIKLISEGKQKEITENLLEKSLLRKSFTKLINNLIEIKEKEEERRNKEEEQKWISQGVLEISEVFKVNNQDLVLLSEQIISQLVNYTHAAQGAIFIYDADSDANNLHLLASYAFGRQRFLEKKVRLGQGLVGACAKEKHSLTLKQVPEEYYKIGTALGNASPKSLYLHPLIMEENLLGVIELASFEELTQREIKLIERIGANIAISLSNAQNNLKTVRLLEQSRSQTEEIQYRENKLKNVIEEQQEHKSELQNKQKEFDEYLKALNAAVAVVLMNITGKISSLNENAKNIFKLKGRNIHTENLLDLKNDSPSVRMQFKENLAMVQEGNLIRQESEYLNIEKEIVYTYEYWNPIRDKNDEITEILLLIFDISQQKEGEIKLHEQTQEMQMQEEIMKQNLEEMMLLQQKWDERVRDYEVKLKNSEHKIEELEKKSKNSKNQ